MTVQDNSNSKEVRSPYIRTTQQTSLKLTPLSWRSGGCYKGDGIRYGLLFPAKFRISHNNVEKEFVDATKALDYAKKIVIPANETEH